MNLDTKLSTYIEDALKGGVTTEELLKHFNVKKELLKNKNAPPNPGKFFWITGLLVVLYAFCLLYTSPSPRDKRQSRMPSSA